MLRLVFRVPSEVKEDVLDGVLPLLPAGVREEESADAVLLTSIAGRFPSREELEAAAGRAFDAFAVDEVPEIDVVVAMLAEKAAYRLRNDLNIR